MCCITSYYVILRLVCHVIEVIRADFKCTTITIAHRIQTLCARAPPGEGD